MSRLGAEALRYYAVGAFVVVLDVCLFQTLLLAHLSATFAAASSSPIAAAVHFSLNRIWSFKSLRSPAGAQAIAYIFVYFLIWIATVGIVAYATTSLGFAPLFAKGIAIVTTLPIGFFGHKYVTYGPGVEFVLRRLTAVARGADGGKETG